MKVAIVNAYVGGAADGGGGLRQALELALGLRAQGHRVTVVSHEYDPRSEYDDPAVRDLEFRYVTTDPVPPDFRGLLLRHWVAMRRVARLIPPDTEVINAHDTPALRAGALASRALRVPLVWTRNDPTMVEEALIPDETIVSVSGPKQRGGRLVLFCSDLRDARHAAAITVLDERNARMVWRAYRRRATLVRSGPAARFFEERDRAAARARLGVPDGAFLVLGVGVLFPHRRFEDLIDAVALLGPDPDVRALVLGADSREPAYAQALADRVGRLGLGERVELSRRAVSDETLRDAYAAADVLVFPNRRQTWGLAPLEALASGTPTIVSSGAGVHEVLQGRPGVVVVPPEDPPALAAALRRVRADGAGSLEPTREWIRAELNRRRYAERMAALFESVVARGPLS